MKSIAKISNFASKYIGIIIIVLSIIAFCFPPYIFMGYELHKFVTWHSDVWNGTYYKIR